MFYGHRKRRISFVLPVLLADVPANATHDHGSRIAAGNRVVPFLITIIRSRERTTGGQTGESAPKAMAVGHRETNRGTHAHTDPGDGSHTQYGQELHKTEGGRKSTVEQKEAELGDTNDVHDVAGHAEKRRRRLTSCCRCCMHVSERKCWRGRERMVG